MCNISGFLLLLEGPLAAEVRVLGAAGLARRGRVGVDSGCFGAIHCFCDGRGFRKSGHGLVTVFFLFQLALVRFLLTFAKSLFQISVLALVLFFFADCGQSSLRQQIALFLHYYDY